MRSNDLGQRNILDAFNNFVRPRENFLEHFKAKAFLKKEPFLTAILASKSRNEWKYLGVFWEWLYSLKQAFYYALLSSRLEK